MALKMCFLAQNRIVFKNFSTITIMSQALCSSSSKIPKNELKGFITAEVQKECGVIYDKKPFRMPLVAGKKYVWCLCGRSKTQPFCDGSHKIPQLKITLKPVFFQVSESKEYWLCNCKQTSNRPFCDGTHKTPAVQEGTSIIRQ